MERTEPEEVMSWLSLNSKSHFKEITQGYFTPPVAFLMILLVVFDESNQAIGRTIMRGDYILRVEFWLEFLGQFLAQFDAEMINEKYV